VFTSNNTLTNHALIVQFISINGQSLVNKRHQIDIRPLIKQINMKFLVFSFLFIGLLEALPSAKSGKDSLADAHQKLNAPVSRAATGKCQDLYEE
jgi:hypothetical protein